jgi:hypothetical protein
MRRWVLRWNDGSFVAHNVVDSDANRLSTDHIETARHFATKRKALQAVKGDPRIEAVEVEVSVQVVESWTQVVKMFSRMAVGVVLNDPRAVEIRQQAEADYALLSHVDQRKVMQALGACECP